MKKGLIWRTLVAVAVLAIATYILVPGLVFFTPPGSDKKVEAPLVEKYFPNTRLNLGLDLLGGIHLTLGVEVEKAVETYLTQLGQDVASEAQENRILIARPRITGDNAMEFILTLPDKKRDFEEMLAKDFPDISMAAPEIIGGGNLLYIGKLTSDAIFNIENMSIDQAVTTIRNRIDQFGVAEPDIRKQQGNRIAVQLPGMDSTQRAINIIGQTAHLEFRIVKGEAPETMLTSPPGTEIMPMSDTPPGMPPIRLIVEKEASLTGEYITDAKAMSDPDTGGYAVSMSFNRRGGQIFARVTKENVGERLAIVLDGKIHSAPNINSEITGGRASITGRFSLTEANDLALVLRAGSLPAPVNVLEERTVGPSLGQESIDAGVTAALAGFAIVVIFMAIYYGKSGIIADVMIILDVLLILAGMSLLGATMTLPGIAGIVLTIGMAIDANVLIFERIREELKAGLNVKEAVKLGFSNAQRAILDSNLTSIIATVILYQLGSGPIRGFAVTLTLGIIASMFTAIFVSRIVFDYWVGDGIEKLSI